ncbi:MAG: ATP-binding cassette domain-containing protein [Paludibacteraceae bacterium]|nr:ATP-binding cassette domain-containing protein [Paludibacteraceae bacterium]
MSVIEYKKVCVNRQEQPVLKDVNLTVDEGDLIFLLGRVGSGKTTFLKSLYYEAIIASGEARVLDFNLREMKMKQIPMLRRQLGIVFQDFQLLSDRNVHANLEFVLKATGNRTRGEIESRISEVLNYVGMTNKGYRMPHELSGGEQQRIVIARALLNEPKIILADEPTGNLDPVTANELMQLFRQIANEKTAVIMATHRTQIAESTPGARILHFENGNMTEGAVASSRLYEE